jgi:hypothetical protein
MSIFTNYDDLVELVLYITERVIALIIILYYRN